MVENFDPEALRNLRRRLDLTQEEFAAELGIKRSRLANWETGKSRPSAEARERLRARGLDSDVGPPLIPASQLLVPVPYIGFVAASDPVDWTDPFESDTFEYVPPEMGDARGRFACRVASDSMMPMLEPQDVCVFHRTDVPKIGHVILFRSEDNRVTVKQLKHDGESYVLHPLNPRYANQLAEGQMLGYLVGIVREKGTMRMTVFDASGLLP